ncbi:MAG: TerB family tellurite resistance protein, partial [Ignavibacteriaceae bacterium]
YLMNRFLKKILNGSQNRQENISSPFKSNNEKKIQIAACALLVEIGKADRNFTDDERVKIISIMENTFNVGEDYVNELIELSEKNFDENESIYEYTTIINNSFTNDEKFELLKNIWRLIYTDDNLSRYEEHLVKMIGTLLNIEYTNIIGAKLLIKEELNK